MKERKIPVPDSKINFLSIISPISHKIITFVAAMIHRNKFSIPIQKSLLIKIDKMLVNYQQKKISKKTSSLWDCPIRT